ncbi:MAG TPA: hypothetical protein VMS40_10405 [Vicinamibacterales bacterium]|nr:hypothetical protein [Vicinamibacterales bacterium]
MEIFRSVPFSKFKLWIIASPLILVALGGLMTDSAEARVRHNLAYASVAALKARIGDRRNLEFDAVRVTDTGAACIQYRARDGLGGMSRAQAVVLGGEVAQSDRRDGRFEKEWNRQCLGLAHDVTSAVDRFF